jgi:hypothetical protein
LLEGCLTRFSGLARGRNLPQMPSSGNFHAQAGARRIVRCALSGTSDFV